MPRRKKIPTEAPAPQQEQLPVAPVVPPVPEGTTLAEFLHLLGRDKGHARQWLIDLGFYGYPIIAMAYLRSRDLLPKGVVTQDEFNALWNAIWEGPA